MYCVVVWFVDLWRKRKRKGKKSEFQVSKKTKKQKTKKQKLTLAHQHHVHDVSSASPWMDACHRTCARLPRETSCSPNRTAVHHVSTSMYRRRIASLASSYVSAGWGSAQHFVKTMRSDCRTPAWCHWGTDRIGRLSPCSVVVPTYARQQVTERVGEHTRKHDKVSLVQGKKRERKTKTTTPKINKM